MITIYGNQRCGWCLKAKNLAERYSLSFEFKDTDADENLNDLKTRLPDVKSIPQIWWHNRYIGDYESFVNEIENTLGGYGDGKI